MKNKIIINDKKHLQTTIKQEVSKYGNECDLNIYNVNY